MNNNNEATARLKINKLLSRAGWRFFSEGGNSANVQLEQGIQLSRCDLRSLGDDFEKTSRGFVDYLLLDDAGIPLIVLEAKSEGKHPLTGKEQARRYARSQNCRFVLLSNGNLHFFWDLAQGNPNIISSFPTPQSVAAYRKFKPNPERLLAERVRSDYIVLTQRPNYASEAAWKNTYERKGFVRSHKLRFLRPYQLQAVHTLQNAIRKGNDRFLFEMATGTGKTLTAAAVIKLFLRTGNASRVLFLVDRLELEDQAQRMLSAILSADFTTVIYKQNRFDWRSAEVIVTTVQSLLFNNKYQDLFSPTDFDLVISDEAHRSINGNARAVFDFFVGYKLGLTATPRDYLRGSQNLGSNVRDPREVERRLLRDTFRTFGCESGQPTFSYSLLDGVKDGFLVNPTVVDARTQITTQLLADEGFVVAYREESGEEREESFKQTQFEKRFFSDATNQVFCKTFLENAIRDPFSNEVGKSIVFAVSQNHAARLTQTFNEFAHVMYPGKYNSDFAVQVTSQVPGAQRLAVNFANNNLLGHSNFLPEYRTSKVRVCVTVGMMSTGYDCTDVLNIGLFRPIFSPTDFIQIKGRGTRKHSFVDQFPDPSAHEGASGIDKSTFKLFDFFATCEYFELEYDYDQMIELPDAFPAKYDRGKEGSDPPTLLGYQHLGRDILSTIREESVNAKGMKIDRLFFDRFAETVKANRSVSHAIRVGEWSRAIQSVNREVFNKPEDYFTLEKLRRAAEVDRRISVRELLERAFDLIPAFKSKDEVLEEEFNKFVADHSPDRPESIRAIRTFFMAYITNTTTRNAVNSKRYTSLATNASFSLKDYQSVPSVYRHLIPEYIRDYVAISQFAQ